MNRLAYPETWVKGVGSTIKQILRGGLRFKGGAELLPLSICRDEHEDDVRDVDKSLLVPRKEDGAYAWLIAASDRTDNKMDCLILSVIQ